LTQGNIDESYQFKENVRLESGEIENYLQPKNQLYINGTEYFD
jgi:hypothetical protein